MSDVVIGIQVCSGQQRLAELRRVGSRVQVVRLESRPLNAGAVAGAVAAGVPAGRSEESRPLTAGTPGGGCATATTIASLPAADVLIRHFELPAAEAGVLRRLAAHRLEAELPIPLADMVWGCRRSNGTESAAAGGVRVVIQAARAGRVQRCLQSLSPAGAASSGRRAARPEGTRTGAQPGAAVPLTLTTEAEAIRCLYRHGLRLVRSGDCGAGFQPVDAPIANRRRGYAGDPPADAAGAWGLGSGSSGPDLETTTPNSTPQARGASAPPGPAGVPACLAHVPQPGVLPQPLSRAACRGELLVLASADGWLTAMLEGDAVLALRRVLWRLPGPGPAAEGGGGEAASRECEQLVAAEAPPGGLRRIVWCGGPEAAPAAGVLAERLGVPAVEAEAAAHLVDAQGQPITGHRLAAYGVAIGLALAGLHEPDELIRFDRPGDADRAVPSRLERMLARPGRWTAAAAALLAAAFGLHAGLLAWEAGRMEAALAAAHAEAGQDPELARQLQAVERLVKYRIGVEDITAALAEVLPDSVILSSLQLSRERRLTIKGKANDFKDLFTFADGLRKSPHFASVSPERTEGGDEPDRPGGSFTITAELPQVEKLTSLAGRGGRWR